VRRLVLTPHPSLRRAFVVRLRDTHREVGVVMNPRNREVWTAEEIGGQPLAHSYLTRDAAAQALAHHVFGEMP